MAVVEKEIILNQVRGRGENGRRALGLPEGEVEMPAGGLLRAKIFAELSRGFGEGLLNVDCIVRCSPDCFQRGDALADGLRRPVGGAACLIVQFSPDNHLTMITLTVKWARGKLI
jgi:hypothetical protein